MYLGSAAASERIFCRAELIGMSDWATTAGTAASAAVARERSMLMVIFPDRPVLTCAGGQQKQRTPVKRCQRGWDGQDQG